MSLVRSFLRFLRRNKKVAAKRNKIYLELLEPRILLDAMTYMARTGGIDGTLRLQNVGGVDTLQLIKNNEQSVLVRYYDGHEETLALPAQSGSAP